MFASLKSFILNKLNKIMTQKKKEKKEMKDFVCEYFIRVCKNHDIYGTFRSSFMKLRGRGRCDSNPFGEFKNIYELSDRLKEFTDRDFERHARDNSEYERTTMMINHMLHFFLEKGGIDPRKLGMIGQEIFDLSCYGMYGDKYLQDMEKLHQTEPRPRNDKEAYLLSQFMNLKAQSKEFKNMSWEEFLERFMPQLNWSEDDSEQEEGYEDDDSFDGNDIDYFDLLEDDEQTQTYDRNEEEIYNDGYYVRR